MPKQVKKTEPYHFECVERIPSKKVIELLYSDYKIPRNNYSLLLEYLTCEEIHRYYFPSKEKEYLNYGRLYSNGLQNVEKKIRGFLCNEIYIDLDIHRCYPSCIVNLCKKLNYTGKMHTLENYIKMKDTTPSIKKSVNMTIFRGDTKLDSTLKDQINMCVNFLIEQARLDKLGNMNNIKLSNNSDIEILTIILQAEERRILDIAILQLQKEEIDIITLCADGLIVSNKINNEIVQKINMCIFPYEMKIKPWTLPEITQIHKLENFNWESKISINDLTNSYTQFHDINHLHEKILPLVLHSCRQCTEGIIIKKGKEYEIYDKLPNILLKLEFTYAKEKPINFENLLKKYNRLITVNGIDNYNNIHRYFSTWKGFQFTIKEKVDKTKIKVALDFFKEIIANNNKEFYKYFLNWLSFIIQNKGTNKTEIAIVLSGLEGTGKSTLMNFLYLKLFGQSVTHKDQGLSSLTTRFNSHLSSKLLVLLEELKSSSSSNWSADLDSIKDLITGSHTSIEKKYANKRIEQNCLNILAFTNYSNSIPFIAGNARRFLLFEISSEKKNDFTYFSNLNKELTQEVADNLGTYLLNRDISDVNIKLMPNTEQSKEQMLRWLPSIEIALLILFVRNKEKAEYITTREVAKVAVEFHLEGLKKKIGQLGFDVKSYLGKANEQRKYFLTKTKKLDITEDKINYIKNYMDEIKDKNVYEFQDKNIYDEEDEGD